MKYSEFINTKNVNTVSSGINVELSDLNPNLFDWQKPVVRWALKKGRAALFLDTGLGKTVQQLEWASQVCKKTGGNVLVLTPLAVAQQTVAEAVKHEIETPVRFCHDRSEVDGGISITNYQKLDRFCVEDFDGIVLDESSILKSIGGKTKEKLIESFQQTPYRLACTATPAPNDFMELGNHCDFLGVMTRGEMLSMYFVHDGGDTAKWRLKGHAESKFWEFMASWSVMIRKPSDIGFTDEGYNLPPLNFHTHEVQTSEKPADYGLLFHEEAKTLGDQRHVRRTTINDRCKLAASLHDGTKQTLVWCELNKESDTVKSMIDGSINVEGSMKDDKKESALLGFSAGEIECLVTKPKIAGHGMNWQNCNRMIFLGLSHSFEQFYQSVRRCYRFGQTQPVDVHIVTTDRDAGILENIKRKQADADKMAEGMIAAMSDITSRVIRSTANIKTDYVPKAEMIVPRFLGVENEPSIV